MAKDISEELVSNIGIFSLNEQDLIARSSVAVAGCGGDGGMICESLVRSGVQKLAIADPERFEITNLNRQYASSQSSIGEKKVLAISRELRKIKPHLKLRVFEEGIKEDIVSDFVSSGDIIVDEMDVDLPDLSIMLQREARRQNKYVVMGLNVAFGARLLIFDPLGITLEQFMEGSADRADFIKKLVSNFPEYVDPGTLKLVLEKNHTPPSVSPGVHLVSALVTTWVLTLLSKKAIPPIVPKAVSIDLLTLNLEILNNKTGG